MNKTPEQMVEELKAMGIDLGEWVASDGGDVMMPLVGRQVEAMLKLKSALETMVARDLASLDRLREQVQRLEHGGGS